MKKSAKIIHVNKAFFPEIGGVESVCHQYVELSKEFFDEVIVLTTQDKLGALFEIETLTNVKIYRCKYQFKLYGHRASISFFFILLMFCFKKYLILAHDPFPLSTLAFFLKKPKKLFVVYHSDIVKQLKLKKIVDWLRYKVLTRCDGIITTSPILREKSDILSHIKHDNTAVIPIYLDNLSEYTKKQKSLTIKSTQLSNIDLKEDFLLLFGRLNYYKGLDYLLEAVECIISDGFELHSNILIAGKIVDAEAANAIRKLKNSSDKIFIVDEVISKQDKICLLQKCSGLLFPSTKNSEAFGIVQLEAMACGKAVINMDLESGVPWVSQDGITGKTLSTDDVKAFANLLRNKDNQLEETLKLGKNSQHNVQERFSHEAVASVIKRLFSEHN